MKIYQILPHCSTGGMPQYALKMVQTFENQLDITVFEVNNVADEYIVQLKQFKNLVQLKKDQALLLKHIKEGKPDILHFQEVPESFIDREILNQIYDNERDYKIVVTAHGMNKGRSDFRYLPDRLVAVSNWQKAKFEKEFPEVEVDKWEYPIEDLKPTPEEKLKCSDELYRMMYCPRFDCGTAGYTGYTKHYPEKKHVLNVGLFTPNKNQGELFEIARKNPQNNYHFVGNQAPNEEFMAYWKPLMANKPTNCFVWGERDDVDFFYKACDGMYFTSKWELFPICVREALSYGLPIKMHKLETYGTDYDNNPLVKYV